MTQSGPNESERAIIGQGYEAEVGNWVSQEKPGILGLLRGGKVGGTQRYTDYVLSAKAKPGRRGLTQRGCVVFEWAAIIGIDLNR